MILDFNNVKVKWLGHDGYKFNFNNLVIYIDPFEIKEQEKADIVLITHTHYDHFSLNDLKKISNEKTLIVGPYDINEKLKGVMFSNLKLLKPGENFNYKGITISTVPAYNINKQFHPKDKNWLGYVFTINGIKFYHAGDTDFIPEMSDIVCDVAFLPVSGTYVMTAEEAVESAKKIMPKIAIPMHYGKIVGELKDAEKFKKLCTFCQVKIIEQ